MQPANSLFLAKSIFPVVVLNETGEEVVVIDGLI
jgi:hypothetical protein